MSKKGKYIPEFRPRHRTNQFKPGPGPMTQSRTVRADDPTQVALEGQELAETLIRIVQERTIYSLKDVLNILEIEYNALWTYASISRAFRTLGIARLPDPKSPSRFSYKVMPLELTRGDIWDEIRESWRLLGKRARLVGNTVCLNVQAGTAESFEIAIDGLREEPTIEDGIVGVLSGSYDVIVYFDSKTRAGEFWNKIREAEQ